MRTRWLGTLAAAAVAALLPVLASAAEAPHDASFSDGSCDNCHAMYDTSASGAKNYAKGCITCHNNHPGGPSGFPWQTSDQATPGLGGSQHSWSGPAVNAARGAQMPSDYSMYKRVIDGNLQCAVCHDAHNGNPTYAPNSRQTSIPVGVAQNKSGGATGGTGQMTLVTPGSKAAGYRVQIQTVNGGTGGTFILSHDFGLATPSWFNWNGAAWVAGTSTGTGMPFTNGAAVALDDPAVTVKFSAGYVVGNNWDFYVAFPFLRVTNVADALCKNCHAERVMNATRAMGNDPGYAPNGSRLFSHPVNVSMDPATIADTNGVLQTTGDGNGANDLKLDAGVVRCTTCHAVHNASSSSLTLDAR
ncbi:hypothetical protein [Anaeromyxobacter oryzae]|uniref:Outer membrane cytochrome MtrC/MtrF-like domain-containing protein n=1 Tax=Anaeromyxobacter oryzae TaxID=2918170 RepID=A0ABN6N0W6_9BACT|nr:hypothetical protein [Anaeromyxobacter oryzae]BDG06859.1 hypothetical protein AMOR_58550 [Anaeromyxobacter oryzae]